jgi:hypothetical protein
MAESLIQHSFNSSVIYQRPDNGYINLNQMADATGKRVQDWLDNQSTKALIEQFDLEQDLNHANQRDLKKAIDSRRGRHGGTWAHPDIAIQFAQWCSPAFALQVSRWVREWMTTGRNPLADTDRVGLRDALKDEARLKMTDQIKDYLEQIQRYDDKKFSGLFFAKVHDAINIAITTETSKEMRNRLSSIVGKEIKQHELIRDYFPITVLSRYISLCEVSTNLMIRDNLHPESAVEEAARLVLPSGYVPKPIDFVEHIKVVRDRVAQSLDYRRDDLYKRLADK